MAPKEFHYRWLYDLKSDPDELWPLVADTNRFNRDAGLPTVESTTPRSRLENARRRLRLNILGMSIEWEEEPFEWVRPFKFGVARRYMTGPVASLRVQAHLELKESGGTNLVYEVWAQPRSMLGSLAIPLQVGIISRRNFSKVLRRFDTLAKTGKEQAVDADSGHADFAPGGLERLRVLSNKLAEHSGQPEIAKRLGEMIERADDLSLSRIRSHVFADFWKVPRANVLEVCLHATRLGLLDLQWELICPHCRGAQETAKTLSGVHSNVYCATCDIDFTVNFDQLVELTFKPNEAIRRVEAKQFCVGGPQLTPHVVAQQLLAAGERRDLTIPMEKGRYRLRNLELPGEQLIQVADEGRTEVMLSAEEGGWTGPEVQLNTKPNIHFENSTGKDQLFILERMAWTDQAATAAEVTALQIFRDLFSNEALRPGEQISVGTLTILFTDLRDSTRLYREIGDAPAFGSVMSHFDVLKEEIGKEDGALVKTIGDAIMAVFRRPSGALRSILEAQQRLANPPAGQRPLKLKAGIHSGPCIAVTLNDRLDYFGGTVNMAARLEGLSTGEDVIISQTVQSDPEVQSFLAASSSGVVSAPFRMSLKGFDEESFELIRVSKAPTAVARDIQSAKA